MAPPIGEPVSPGWSRLDRARWTLLAVLAGAGLVVF
jgi:hypothetical protein